MFTRPLWSTNTHQPKKSPSTSVGARVVEWGREGLDGRPRPVPYAHLWGNALTPPAPGDHKGPPFPTSSALAPTDHPASCLASRLGLIPIGQPLWSCWPVLALSLKSALRAGQGREPVSP